MRAGTPAEMGWVEWDPAEQGRGDRLALDVAAALGNRICANLELVLRGRPEVVRFLNVAEPQWPRSRYAKRHLVYCRCKSHAAWHPRSGEADHANRRPRGSDSRG